MIPDVVLSKLATPCYVIDLAAADRNIAMAAEFYRKRRAKLRPHFKAHKMTALMRRQIDAGSCVGVTCATAWEAEVLANAGFTDILVANQVVDKAGLAALARAAKKQDVTVAVDCDKHVELLEKLAADHQVNFAILIEIDVGMGRCGLILNSDDLIPLAKSIIGASRLRFRGLQGYEGHVVMREDRALRYTMAWQAQEVLRHERDRLKAAGIDCDIISGGGTGTFDIAADIGILDEIQAGSYVLMDAKYASFGLPFETALYCCASVISRRAEDAAVLNAGLKSLTAEYGMPKAADGGFSVIMLADEHSRITPRAGSNMKVGDRLLMVPPHIDPGLNLQDSVAVWAGGSKLMQWPVDGRWKPHSLFE